MKTVACIQARGNKTVGRESRGGAGSHHLSNGLPAQCGYDMQPLSGRCVGGKVLKEVTSSKVENGKAIEELLCEACEGEPSCAGWTKLTPGTGQTYSNTTALQNKTKTPAGGCLSALKRHSSYNGGQSGPNWYTVVNSFGGHWYSTPAAGQCKAGEALGTNDCTWRLVADEKYM